MFRQKKPKNIFKLISISDHIKILNVLKGMHVAGFIKKIPLKLLKYYKLLWNKYLAIK